MRTIMNEKHASRLFWAIKALLGGILLYVTVAVIVTPLYLGRALKPLPVSGDEHKAEPASTEPRSRPPTDLSAIIESGLFAGTGDAQAQMDPGAPSSPNAMSVEDELGLKLIGAIAGDPSTSRAVIQNKATGAALPYKVGDVIGPATVESIESDRVVVRLAGRRKVLPLQSGAVGPTRERPGEDKPQNVAAAAAQSSAEPQPRQGPPKLSYLEDVFHKAKVEPYVQKGQTEGLKITGLQDTPLTGFFGLKNGDVVQTINGQNLTSKQKAFQVIQKAKTQSKLQLQLLRDGKTKELSLDLR
jgi:type II secretion system protein C